MGTLFSTPDAGRAAADTNWATFPPKSGVVFSSHFYLGGEKFDSVARESYIFNDSSELHYLNSKPLTLPFGVSKPGHVSQPLRALLSVRKETVRFVKASLATAEGPAQQQYNIEFVFDCLVNCTVSLFLFAKESFNGQQLVVEPQNAMYLSPEKAAFAKGRNLVFSKTDVIVRPALHDSEVWDIRDSVFPIAILLEADEPGVAGVHQQLVLCTAEKQYDSTFSLKVLKQKQVIDGVVLVLHDLFGISDRDAAGLHGQLGQEPPKPDGVSEELDDDSADCIICMGMPRDTLILPCRHLCLCAGCADSLRYQASACPICRSPFKALLQLSVLRPTARRRQDKAIYRSLRDLNASTSRACEEAGPQAEAADDASDGEQMRMRSLHKHRRDPAPQGFRSVPILEFVDEQRQQQVAALQRRRASASAKGRSQAWGTPTKVPAPAPATSTTTTTTTATTASASATAGGAIGAAVAGRRRKSLSSSRSLPASDDDDDDDDSCASSSPENDWADSESGADDVDQTARASGAPGQASLLFNMPVTDLTLVVPDGDADRGSCSTSTESGNSHKQLLGPRAAMATGAKAGAAMATAGADSADSDLNDAADVAEV